jgi:hypothetical protein
MICSAVSTTIQRENARTVGRVETRLFLYRHATQTPPPILHIAGMRVIAKVGRHAIHIPIFDHVQQVLVGLDVPLKVFGFELVIGGVYCSQS